MEINLRQQSDAKKDITEKGCFQATASPYSYSNYLLQEILEVDVLSIGHVLQTILGMDFLASRVILPTHRVIHGVPWETSCFTLVALLLLHPCDNKDLGNDNREENAPDCQDTLESIDLIIR